jgi:diketogulonate reductase-like aldo/keto reductase
VEYIDLVLMHAPTRFPRIPYLMNPLSDECGYAHLNRTMCHYRTWTALSRLRTEGTIRNVGVSNFGYSKDDDDDENENDDKGPQDGSLAAIVALHEKVDSVKYAPVTVNQMVYNPWISDEWMKTIQYCRDHQIQIVGYNTLGGNFQHRQASTIDVLLKLATKYSKGSVAQIMIKWAIQKGVAVIPGTSNPHHMRENLAVYDAFQLTDEEIEEIDSLRTSESAKQFFSIEPSVWA